MYAAFQSCRHLMGDAAPHLRALVAVLDAVHQQNVLVVDVPRGALGSLVGLAQQGATSADAEFALESSDAVLHSKIFVAIEVGARELERLIAAGSSKAVSSLGYALHVLPDLVRFPAEFRPELYAFNFGRAARHWDELSAPMRDALRALVGVDLANAVLKKVQRTAVRPS